MNNGVKTEIPTPVTKVVNSHLAKVVEAWRLKDQQLKKLEHEIAELKQFIIDAIDEKPTTLVFQDRYIAEYAGHNRTGVDSGLLAEKFPSVYKKVLKTQEVYQLRLK